MLKENKERFGLRKLSVGLASVMLGVVAVSSMNSKTVHADTINDNDKNNAIVQNNDETEKNQKTVQPAKVVQEIKSQVSQNENVVNDQVASQISENVNKIDANAVSMTVRGGGLI